MKSFCMFKEHINSPIFESQYDFETGLIDKVPNSRFEYQLPEFFIRGFDLPPNYGLHFSKEYYVLALQITNGLVALNFYDVGITIISSSGVYVMFFEGYNVKHYENVDVTGKNIFNFTKFPVGIYKTVVRQLDIAQQQCYLYVDSNGSFATDKGVVSTIVTVPRTMEELSSITGAIVAFRNGQDGILITNEGTEYYFKVKDSSVSLSYKINKV